VVGAVLVFRDVSEQRDIEIGLEKISKELEINKKTAEEANEFSQSLINTIREPLLSLDKDLRVVTVSRSFYEFFKVNPEETVGQLIYDLGNKQWDIPKLRELLETILPQKASFDNYEVEHDFATIGRRIMLLNARQIERGKDKERIILLAIEDITERKYIEKELDKTSKELERIVQAQKLVITDTKESLGQETEGRLLAESEVSHRQEELEVVETHLKRGEEMRLLGQLTSGVAHEVRNPLNGILAVMGALSKELSDEKRFEPYMQHMRNQVNRLTGLMENLLELGRPLRVENMHAISMVTLVENTLSTWLMTIHSPKPIVQFIKPEASQACIIKADVSSITQIIINLLENSYNHSPAGVDIICSVGVHRSDRVFLTVTDGGKGIPKEFLSKIFDPFFTTRKGGTGLGLSIVRTIVENHHGVVTAYNNSNGPGATFEVVLPLFIS
jgi:PAS domain S-box-containing protein